MVTVRGWGESLYVRCYRLFLSAVERGYVPDVVVRVGIRYLLKQRLQFEYGGTLTAQLRRKLALVEKLKTLPIAIHTEAANDQHYEVPTEYFDLCLGKWKKYSCCLYKSPHDSLQTAEEQMLSLYCAKAGVENGMRVLDLGCGWGSLSLFIATAFPGCHITAVSNSKTQKAYIETTATREGLGNVTVVTSDINVFQSPERFDRILSIEMFEHMKNYQVSPDALDPREPVIQELLKKVASWLKPHGKVFIHHFCHKSHPYEFEVEGEDDWMAKYFFTGGTMPSLDLLLYFQEDLVVKELSYINGTHYSDTLESWLQKMDSHKEQILPLFKEAYRGESEKWFMYWRLFYMACSELFSFKGGEEWGVAHVLLEHPQRKGLSVSL